MANIRNSTAADSSLPVSGRRLLDGITQDSVWAETSLQYYLGGSSALDIHSDFSPDLRNFFPSGFTDSSFAFTTQTVRAFDMIDSVSGLDFTRVTNATTARNQADLVVVTHYAANSGTEGFFQFPGTYSRGSNDYLSLGVFNSGLSVMTATPERGGGEYLYWTVIHEIGHGIGLLHPHQEVAGGPALQVVGEDMNNERYTVMSYHGATSGADSYGHAVSLMALDIAALQQQYGAEAYATGNSTYTLFDARGGDLRLTEGNVQIGRAYFSIWDSGGTDTITYGNSTNSVLINLNDATLNRSSIASDAAPSLAALRNTQFYNNLSADLRTENIDTDFHAGGFFSRVLTQSGNTYSGIDGGFSIANGANIENAIGGAQEDLLIGNELDNTLTGAAGADVLIGGGGNDILQGGAGDDIAAYAGNRSSYTITQAGDGYRITGGDEGSDVLTGVEFAQFSDTLVNLAGVTPQPGVNLTGTAGNDRLVGTVSNDTLAGGAGNDTLIGLDNDDVLYGGEGDDLLSGDANEYADEYADDSATGGRLTMGNGIVDLSRTVAVPDAIRANHVAYRADAGFSLSADSDVGNTATTIPHLTIGYSFSDGAGYGYLALDVVEGERIIIDVDYMASAAGTPDGYLRVYDASGTLVAYNDDYRAEGETSDSLGGTGSSSVRDPFIDVAAEETGTYFVEISEYPERPVSQNTQFEINISQDFGTAAGGSGPSVAVPGHDNLDGGNGNDTLEGGDGADTLNGGSGNDLIFGGSTSADLRDVIYGGAGNDTIDGGYGNDELRGDAGNDNIAGGFGADTVIGADGNDTLTGSAFGDLLYGGDGDDFINGGFGSDRINGGNGGDRFFHLGIRDHGNDWIQDYDAAEGDQLVFGGAANTAVSQFQINTAFTANAGTTGSAESFVIYRPTGQILWALVDGDAQDEINLRIGSSVYDLTDM